MQYSFDIQEAVEYGVNEAIMIWNFRFWVLKNKANNKHMYDGRTWTYNTIKAFESLFPFWSVSQLRTTINNLVKKEVIIKGNYNKSGYDRTVWYAFVDEERFLSSSKLLSHLSNLTNGDVNFDKSNCQNEQMDLSNKENRFVKNSQPIPNIKSDIKTFISLTDEEKKEFLKKVWKETNLKSDFEKYFLFRAKDNWKIKNLEFDILWWENGFKEKNPILYQETIKTPRKLKNIPKDDKKNETIGKLKFALDNFGGNGKDLFFTYFRDAEFENGVVFVKNEKALAYRDMLEKKMQIKIELKKAKN